jgi:mRNA interferase RelE/StbE
VIVEFDKSFEKSIDKIKDKSVFPKIEKLIIDLENAQTIKEVKNIKKLSGFKTYYRIRLGVYRIGLEKITDSTLRLIIVAHRKDIYKNFP